MIIMAKKMKVTRKYQITIPQEIREKLHLKEGDEIKIHQDGKKIIIELIKDRSKDPILEMLSLVEKPLNVDAVKLVEESWNAD